MKISPKRMVLNNYDVIIGIASGEKLSVQKTDSWKTLHPGLIIITKVVPSKSVDVFRKDQFSALFFSLSSTIIFWLLCLLLSAALFTLTIWPFGPPPLQFPLQWRPHKELCFDWSTGLRTGVFLSIQANVRSPSSQWIPTN